MGEYYSQPRAAIIRGYKSSSQVSQDPPPGPKETTNTLGTPGLCEQFTKPGVGEYASNSAVHWERAEPTYP